MTIDDVKRDERPFLPLLVVAQLLQCNEHELRLSLRERPNMLPGVAPIFTGSHTKIPRKAFIRYWEVHVG